MMKRFTLLMVIASSFLLFTGYISVNQEQDCHCTAYEAIKYVGQNCTVTGKVNSFGNSDLEYDMPLFIHFEEPYPIQPFKIVIWADNLYRFPKNFLSEIENKTISVSGEIDRYGDCAQIVVSDYSDITIIK